MAVGQNRRAQSQGGVVNLLYGDLVLHPATVGEPARVTGGLNPAGLVGVPLSIAGAR
jgi:hypothetical protein